MKATILLLFVLFISVAVNVFGQVKKPASSQNYLLVTASGDDITLELLPMPVGMSPNLSDAKIGIKYFGAKSEGGLSFVLILKGSKSRYSTGQSFGVQLLVDDIPISSSKYRIVSSVKKTGTEENLYFHISTEELAWLATGDKLKIVIYNTDTVTKLDTLLLTASGVAEVKAFAKAVYLIRSKSEN